MTWGEMGRTLSAAMLFAVGLPVLLLIGATALLIVGLRGRRIDDHPLCRRCGFDLIGLPRESSTCSECGASLATASAIRTGHRARRSGLIWFAAFLFLPSLGWLGVLVYGSAADLQWVKYQPTWYVLREAPNDPAALAELMDRLARRKLSAGQINAVVAKALQVQADRKNTWNRGWGDFVDLAQANGRVLDEHWLRYRSQALVMTMRARPEIARGDPLWVEVTLTGMRLGNGWTPDVIGIEASRDVSGHDCGASVTGGFTFRNGERGPLTSGSLLRIDPDVSRKLKSGAQTLTVSYDVELRRGRGIEPVVAPVELETTFHLNDAPPPTVTVENDGNAWLAIMSNASVHQATYFPSGDMSLSLRMVAPQLFDLAYDVFARLPDGSERKLTSFVARRGTTAESQCYGDVGRLPPDLKTIDLVLRPSVPTALQSLNLTRLCATDVRIDAVLLWRAGQNHEAREVNAAREVPIDGPGS